MYLNCYMPKSKNKRTKSQEKRTVKERAIEIYLKTGKRSVILPDGTRINLVGPAHINPSGQRIETPHTHEAIKEKIKE